MPSHPNAIIYRLAVFLLCGLPACVNQDPGPRLIVQRDSAGVEIIEATRPLWGDSSPWSINPEPVVDLALSGSGPNHEFFRIRGLKQRLDGSLVVVNRGSQQVRLYSREGDFLGALGGPGEGPGEFNNLWRVELVADTVFALDTDGRVTVVDPDMDLIRTFALPHQVFEIHSLGDGTLLAESSIMMELKEAGVQLIRPPTALVRFDLKGIWIDSIGVRPGRESFELASADDYISGPALFGRASKTTTLGPRVFYGSSDLMQVEELDPAGNLARILRISDYPLGLTAEQFDAERQAMYDASIPPGVPVPPRFRRMIESQEAAANRPAFNNMLVDASGAIWLELYRGVSERDRPQEWLILDVDGTWLGTVRMPDRFSLTDITMEAVVGVWRDELDIEHPQVLRLNRNGG